MNKQRLEHRNKRHEHPMNFDNRPVGVLPWRLSKYRYGLYDSTGVLLKQESTIAELVFKAVENKCMTRNLTFEDVREACNVVSAIEQFFSDPANDKKFMKVCWNIGGESYITRWLKSDEEKVTTEELDDLCEVINLVIGIE